jgi:hypothetical protein
LIDEDRCIQSDYVREARAKRSPGRIEGSGIRFSGEETGAPGENRTPNLMVRSHALYPIELRAHRGRMVFENYNGNRTVSSNRIVECVPRMGPDNPLSQVGFTFQIPPDAALVAEPTTAPK